MIRVITMLSLLSAVFCQYPRQRAPALAQNQPQQRPQPIYEDDIEDYRPKPRNNVVYQPAPVHYVNIGAELAGDYKFGYDTGKDNGGQSFREETRLPDGSVQGAYGYTDETGKQRIVKYTAGKEGFKVIKDDEADNKRSAPESRPQRTQPEVHRQAYRSPPPQQAYMAPPQQAYNPPQPQPSQSAYRSTEPYRISEPSYRASTPQRYAPEPQSYAPEPQSYAPEPQRYAPEPQSYAPEPQRYAPEPQSYAPEPQRYAPEPQRYAPEPQSYAPKPQSYAPRSRSRSSNQQKARYTPAPASDSEEDYDYDNDVTERRLAPIDTSLLNYNIGTSSNAAA